MKRTRELLASDADKQVKVIIKMDYPNAYKGDVIKNFEYLTNDLFLALEKHFNVSKIKVK